MLDKGVAEARFPKFMRELIKATKISTANGKASVDKGVRICSGPWDCATDAILMKNSPNLSSLGQRTMHAGFSFIWIRERFPCFISPCCTMIIIFDLHGVIPIYSPCMETFQETMLGSFELCSNMFRKMCGIYIGDDGIIRLDLMPVPRCLSPKAKAEQKREKKRENVVEKGRNQDVPSIPAGSLAGGTSFDSKFFVCTRREDRNAKRFVTLPKTALSMAQRGPACDQ